MRLDLPYPHKSLWPNGRPHWATKSRETKKHKGWAYSATKAEKWLIRREGPIALHVVVQPKATGPLPDKDNVVASIKAYQDGIAAALGLDDRHFDEPTVEFSDERKGRFLIEVRG